MVQQVLIPLHLNMLLDQEVLLLGLLLIKEQNLFMQQLTMQLIQIWLIQELDPLQDMT